MGFLVVYIFFNVLFITCLVGMFGFAEQTFRAMNMDGLKDGSRMAIKSLSFMITLFLSIFYIPMITLNI
jgi:hypothetical protein